MQARSPSARGSGPCRTCRPLERLRRRHRDLTARDVFGAPEATEAGRRLKRCAAACEDYAERVFSALHRTPEDER
ncbi:Chromate resistance protein ChrB [Streptomyces sp. NPDC086549]|uniref:Chromate resistance protein ChrB n=1 Tax=Streptomyces sp. NPDC086549 TaxID=3365752 RepID=UPI003815190F